ncbi:hypothetical protein [Burkholderia cepacia]|uniref:hypothetical protein n=1 Tax=Burkholderia cepacia TaxID=292 RepID=UPI002AB5F53F|nr:hypothetical protein [Burkholderia cepacia]
MNSSTAASPRDRQVAVVPVNEIPPADVALSISAFDDWLVRISNGAVTLDRIRTAAGVIPVLGNILALADVFGDIVTLVESKERHMLDWVSLGINLIGVVPLPGTAAARVSLRPTLFLVRQELRQNGKRFVGEALFNVLATNLNASIKGELEDFVAKAQAELPGFIEKAATYGEQLIVDLANGLDALVLGNLDASGSLDEAGDQLFEASGKLWRDARGFFSNVYGASVSFQVAVGKAAVNKAVQVIPASAREPVLKQTAALRKFSVELGKQIRSLGNANIEQSIMWIINGLALALAARGGPRGHGANVKSGGTSTSRASVPGHTVEPRGREGKAGRDANPPKNGACPTTCGSISFAKGSEILPHTDFMLPGPFPVETRPPRTGRRCKQWQLSCWSTCSQCT